MVEILWEIGKIALFALAILAATIAIMYFGERTRD